ncbi:MAG: hypothetical protein ACI4JK_03595 [Oscillospiraceae bacterium]
MTLENIDVKLEAIRNGVKLYQIPAKLGICSSTFERLMRTPLKDEDRERVLNAIKEIAANC